MKPRQEKVQKQNLRCDKTQQPYPELKYCANSHSTRQQRVAKTESISVMAKATG